MQSFKDIWELMLRALSERFSETIMELWFNHLEIAALSDTAVILVSDSNMKADIINKRYKDTLAEAFEAILGFPVNVVTLADETHTLDREKLQKDIGNGQPVTPYPLHTAEQTAEKTAADPAPTEQPKESAAPVQEESAPPAPTETEKKEAAPAEPQKKEQKKPEEQFFNSEYTFENFIVGSSNKFAHAACVAVANNPARAYNPLFIWGPSGLGKTHLLYAITNHVRSANPNAQIAYVKGETFTNQLIESISTETTASFREKYRQADVFLLDDVQFIAGKVSTQEEFFNTFNDLYEAKKQIILTSDRPPKEIKTLEDRLKTRFEWGLIVDIQPPDLELRIAILRKKAEFMGIDIPIEVLNYLGENLKSNIRQIEGAIKRLGAYSNLIKQPITLEMAKENIADVVPGAEPVKVTQDKIFAAVAHKYGVTVDEIKGTKRSKDIAMARHVSIYIMRTVTDMSLPSIGKVFNRDHTTILASIDRIKDMIRNDANAENDIDDLVKEINGK